MKVVLVVFGKEFWHAAEALPGTIMLWFCKFNFEKLLNPTASFVYCGIPFVLHVQTANSFACPTLPAVIDIYTTVKECTMTLQAEMHYWHWSRSTTDTVERTLLLILQALSSSPYT